MTRRDFLFSSIFYFLVMILLVFSMYHLITGSSQQLTFTSFIDWLENFHPILPNIAFDSHAIEGTWGFLDGIRVFINSIITILDFGVYAAKSFINTLSYLSGFLVFMFTA